MIKTVNFSSNSIFELTNQLSTNLNFNEKTIFESEILVQVFLGKVDKNIILQIQKLFKFYIPNAKVIGTTTDGEIADGRIYENSIITTITIFEKTKLKTFFIDNSNIKANSFQVGQKIANQIFKKKESEEESLKTIITFIDGLNSNGEEYLRGLNSVFSDVIVAGGMAGENGNFIESFIFDSDSITSSGAVAVAMFSDDLIVNNNYHFGWVPIGEKFKVTEVDQNIVKSIDGVPPLEIYKKYLGEEFAEQLPFIGVEFPLIIEKPIIDSKNGINRIGRAVLNKFEDGSLAYAGNLHVGDEVRFGIGNYESILSISKDNSYKYQSFPAESIFVYSCMARRRFLQNDTIIIELSQFKNLAPTSGFFTYGEFFSNKKDDNNYDLELLNQTMTVLTLSETDKIPQQKIEQPKLTSKSKSRTIEALSHIIDATSRIQKRKSDELEYLNSSLEAKIHKAVEENRKKDQMILRHSKLAQMGELISMIAHQWRQPLGAISSTILGVQTKLQLGKFDLSDPKDADKCELFVNDSLGRMTEYVKFLSDTIDEFRSFFKPNRTPEKLNTRFLIDKAHYIIEKSLNAKNIVLQKNCNSERDFLGYKNELIQVILNLFKNAEDVLLEKNIKNGRILVSCYSLDKYEVLEISDNAGGIPNELFDRIFEPYFSTKTEKNGTGLGLYMSKTIIEEHCKGNLEAFNNEEGAVFRIGFDTTQKEL